MRLIQTYIIAIVGSLLFYALHLPLPWVLGAVTALLIYKTSLKKEVTSSNLFKQLAFVLLGIQLGLGFTDGTFSEIGPYFFPYLLVTGLLIGISLFNGFLVSKWSAIQTDTSMLATIPGGLSASIALSDSLKSNTVLVTIFHTIRLMAVLFIVPFVATHFLYEGGASGSFTTTTEVDGAWYTLLIYVGCYVICQKLEHKVPAAFVVLPMLIVGTLQALGVSMFVLPSVFFIAAQVTLGIDLGQKVSVGDIKKAGKYCMIYFGLSVWLIALSFLLGYVFSEWMGISLATGVLSVAPGGLLEMALTAQSVGGDPAVVSSLQMVRLLIVVLLVPVGLKWFFQRKQLA